MSFADIFGSEMDRLTYQLENDGYQVWFTCEVDGIEYRLAARKHALPAASAEPCGRRDPDCKRPISCNRCYPWQRLTP